ncbi:MAG: histidine kinase [Proteobacteria bacterium]|nr:histidine kinase [Pseudomonadota bacterium]
MKGLLILACDENRFTPDAVDGVLKKVSVPLFGGVFPAIIHGSEKLTRGTIVAGLSRKPEVHLVPNISDAALDFDGVIDTLVPETENAGTMFVFVDGYSQRICSLIESLYSVFGLGLNYIGGGAGSIDPSALEMSTTPCLFTNDGLIEDGALLALVDTESGVGVRHGWHKISGPYKVTESSGNVIKSLDWRPAFEVYKEIIKGYSGDIITPENFFDIAKRFPFGISRLGSEIIVRDPFTVEGEFLIVATEIPQESFVDVLSGDLDSLVDAAKNSFTGAMDSYQGGPEKTAFLIDCISRVLFLGEDFSREIAAVRQENTPLIGALTLGEIANSGKDYMELYNKTCVVGILGDL